MLIPSFWAFLSFFVGGRCQYRSDRCATWFVWKTQRRAIDSAIRWHCRMTTRDVVIYWSRVVEFDGSGDGEWTRNRQLHVIDTAFRTETTHHSGHRLHHLHHVHCSMEMFNLCSRREWSQERLRRQRDRANALRSLIIHEVQTTCSYFSLIVVSGLPKPDMVGLLTCLYHVSCSIWYSRASFTSGKIRADCVEGFELPQLKGHL